MCSSSCTFIHDLTPMNSKGIWKDSQIAPLKRIVDFCHSQGTKVGVQLAHAGRKASLLAPWVSSVRTAAVDEGGWPDKGSHPSFKTVKRKRMIDIFGSQYTLQALSPMLTISTFPRRYLRKICNTSRMLSQTPSSGARRLDVSVPPRPIIGLHLDNRLHS